MSRHSVKYVWRDGKMVVKGEESRRMLHYIHDDIIEPLEHPCDGKHYSSKSEFEKTTRRHGCICYGDTPVEELMKAPKQDWGDVNRDIAEARELLDSHGDQRDKVMHLIENGMGCDGLGINPFAEED